MTSIARRLLLNSQNVNILKGSYTPQSYTRCIRQMYLLQHRYLAAFRRPAVLSTQYTWSTQSPAVYTPIRQKSNKKNRGIRPEESDDEDEDDSDLGEFKDKLDKSLAQIKVQTLRLDTVIKAGLGFSKSKIEKLFYDSKIRINGKKVTKKAMDILKECEIDIIKGPSPENDDFLQVSRIEILSIKSDGLYFVLTVRRNKNLTIENYESG